MQSAYLLVSHGSRDPRPQIAVETLAQLVREKMQVESKTLASSHEYSASLLTASVRQPLIGTATLELAQLPLNEQIRQFGCQALALGYQRLQVVPLFLLPGVHVMEDIPAELAQAQSTVGNALEVEIRPPLGSHPQMGRLLSFSAEARILLAHGSRREGGNTPVEAVAKQLGAVPAYWSVQPSLEEQLSGFVVKGHREVEILPYFLFSGGITDAIAQSVQQLQTQFPSLELKLGEPIGASEALALMILDLIAS